MFHKTDMHKRSCILYAAAKDADRGRTGLAKSGGMPQFLRAARWERLYASTAAGSPASEQQAGINERAKGKA